MLHFYFNTINLTNICRKIPNLRFIKRENVAYDSETGLIGTGNFSDVYEGKLYGKISVALKIYHEPKGMKYI